MRQLAGKVAVVTGAASGIGLGLARRLAEEAMAVVLADVEAEALERAGSELAARGAEVEVVPTDVSQAPEVQALADRAVQRFGRVELLCNNAGVGAGGLVEEAPASVWDWVLGVNLWGVLNGLRAFLPILRAQPEAHVVNTASVAGLLAVPGMAPYCASKHAVVAVSECLHHETALVCPQVKVSVLCPGWTRTRILDSARNWPGRLGPAPEPSSHPLAQAAAAALRQRVEQGMSPEEVAGLVVEAVRQERFWVLTQPEDFGPAVLERARAAVAGQAPPMPA
ncbi:MAG TPA: SDR family NAD(P)-dependent oxidoreductase [Acidimicrobiales bacterium]|nr:SDR family NAD(P)-dependent oxidoreductase [Acidimicrobiales bacterium]